MPSETTAAALAGRKGIIISGGPSSVYEPGSPTMDAAALRLGTPVLGICYGQQLMAQLLGGVVTPGVKGEYGLAMLELRGESRLFDGVARTPQQIWMSHRDTVGAVPAGFAVTGTTETCAIASMTDEARRLFGVQFHPEVVQTLAGRRILENFLFAICGCAKDWEPTHQVPLLEEQIRAAAAGRRIFFFASGGVDSTVAYTLCLRALGPERVHATYVDTGLMREGETDFVRGVFEKLAQGSFNVEDARAQFLTPLAGVTEPEQKRKIIGEQFVQVQERVLDSGHYLEQEWILGQGTIYPDTIESGGTKHADVIKTHHNRVAGIQRLIEQGRIVEPLTQFYKDEVRELGRHLGLPAELLERHPFPGPGLAIRCLASEADFDLEKTEDGWIVPVHSVGVQGDSRSYRPVLAIDTVDHARATEIINRVARVNRVIAVLAQTGPLTDVKVRRSSLSPQRLERLRRADAIVRRLSQESGFDARIWQFPVVLIPAGTEQQPDSVVLRPIDSVDGMTAAAVPIPDAVAEAMTRDLLAIPGIHSVFLDLTHKPPATIEWE